MFIFLYLFRQLTASRKCEGSNTVLAFTNECVCIDGFPYGDPNSKEGCYKCEQKCHRLSKCEYPGKCVCVPPYHGDGVNCAADIPRLTSFSPKNGTTHGGTNIQIHYSYSSFNNDKLPDFAFCRFGTLVVRSESVTDTIITCQSPPHCAKPAFLSISFDTISWSEDDVFFNFIEIPEEEKNGDQEVENNESLIDDTVNNNRNRGLGFFVFCVFCILLFLALLMLLLKRLKLQKLPFALRRKAIMD